MNDYMENGSARKFISIFLIIVSIISIILAVIRLDSDRGFDSFGELFWMIGIFFGGFFVIYFGYLLYPKNENRPGDLLSSVLAARRKAPAASQKVTHTPTPTPAPLVTNTPEKKNTFVKAEDAASDFKTMEQTEAEERAVTDKVATERAAAESTATERGHDDSDKTVIRTETPKLQVKAPSTIRVKIKKDRGAGSPS